MNTIQELNELKEQTRILSKNARDAKGLRVDHPNFNRETLDLSKLNLDDIDMVPPYARGGIADHFRSR